LIFFGKILKTKGNKGEVVVGVESGCEDIKLHHGQPVILKSEKYSKDRKVEYCKQVNHNVILKFHDINSIEQAYRIIGYAIFVAREKNIRVEDQPLIHFEVRDIHQKRWGTVRAIKQFGLNKILEISENDETIYVPYNTDIIREVRDIERVIVIDPPEGLRDLNK
jgi:16S rRNA processing protein RimM